MSVEVSGGARHAARSSEPQLRPRVRDDRALLVVLDAALREAVRRDGVDPQSEVARVRRLAA